MPDGYCNRCDAFTEVHGCRFLNEWELEYICFACWLVDQPIPSDSDTDDSDSDSD